MKLLRPFAVSATLLATSLTVAACGYSPVYAPGQGAAMAASRVQVGTVAMADPDIGVGERRVAGKVSQRLRLDFPNTRSTSDVLGVTVFEDTNALAVQRNSTVARAQIILTAHITLTSPEGKELLKAVLSTNTTYNVEDSPFGTESGKSFAQQVAAGNLAEEISRRVVLYYRTAGLAEKNTAPAAE